MAHTPEISPGPEILDGVSTTDDGSAFAREGHHGGDLARLASRAGRAPAEILDFSASINPLGPPDWLRSVVAASLEQISNYPEPRSSGFRAALASHWNLDAEQIVVGNGLNELIHALPRLDDCERVVIPVPAYVDYARAAHACGRETVFVPSLPDLSVDYKTLHETLRAGDLVFLGHPSNPAGHPLDLEQVTALMDAHARTIFAVDEAFLDFVSHELSFLAFLNHARSNLIVLRSFTKFYALPGLRLGCVAGSARLVEQLERVLPDWSVNSLAQAVGPRLLADHAYADLTRSVATKQRERMRESLAEIPNLEVWSGTANFLLLRLGENAPMNARELEARLLGEFSLAVRVCDNFQGLGGAGTRFVRVAIRLEHENERLLNALAIVLRSATRTSPVTRRRRTRTPALMLQGTSSNAGKSLMTAALCRILLQDGVRVAPFKAQNMSLNSFVTEDGREIARAQAVQAAACRLAPDYRMNPVLLKPGSDTGSQVLLDGRPVGHMSVLEYQAYKPRAFETVRRDYDGLCEDYDAVVLEGAGSPGEVNLRKNDIVNMRMARYAQAGVLLVGDIDRGGVFAGFVGTMEVLPERERKLVAGFLVNRFRGDARLLHDAYEYMLRHTGRPILGVVPYLPNHGIPEEDSVSFHENLAGSGQVDAAQDALDIVLVDLPFISNFTDFDALNIEPDVRLRVLKKGAAAEAIGRPDVVILPGTRNSLAGLAYLRESGIADYVRRLADEGHTTVVGICGGFQMLGESIRDPQAVESAHGEAAGLGLLPLNTHFFPEKMLRKISARHAQSGHEIRGYEVHHGRSEARGGQPLFTEATEQMRGLTREDGRVWGTYIHGVFDADEFRRWFLDELRARRGWSPLGAIQAVFELEPALDRLAAAVRENIDLDQIHAKMGL